MTARFLPLAAAVLSLALAAALPARAADAQPGDDVAQSDTGGPPRDTQEPKDQTYNEDEVTHAVSGFFGTTTEAAAKVEERVISDLGEPDGYIKGEEGSGAFIAGLRYGSGWLVRKGFEPIKVYWRGPSVGFDFGGNASKCFTLVYNLRQEHRLYQRFPGVEGSFYFIAGIGVNYMRSGGVTLAPMRTGLGVRAGVNAHYQVYSDRRDWFPL
jgi:hypothetical protein